jgi:hypothetical protein
MTISRRGVEANTTKESPLATTLVIMIQMLVALVEIVTGIWILVERAARCAARRRAAKRRREQGSDQG